MNLRLLVLSIVFLFTAACSSAQSDHAALDSMGANINRKNWRSAIKWALKDGEIHPADKYWRYLNAANFASMERDAGLTLHYAKLVVDSDIALKARFGESFDWLSQDERWKQLMAKVAERKEAERQQKIRESLPFRHAQQTLLDQSDAYLKGLDTIQTAEQLYNKIRHTRPLHKYVPSGKYVYHWLSWQSQNFPYLVQLPPYFDPKQSYPVIVVLHGAVGRQTALPDVPDSLSVGFFGLQFSKKASESGMIAVFPYSTRQHNWMMPDDGFELVPELVRRVKKTYSIDDRRVYVAGHSNGATGAFAYLMKDPRLFAGFAGVNNRPQVRTGGTFLLNASNRSFYNIATDFDYYFPLEGHRALAQMARQKGIDWQNREIT